MDMLFCEKYESALEPWHIVREIGEGSFGKVYEIERREGTDVFKAALKVISIPKSSYETRTLTDSMLGDGGTETYFRSMMEELTGEIRIMYGLKGESNIVSYEDHRIIPHTDGYGWDILIRMELLTPLDDYRACNSVDPIELGIDVCKALVLCGRRNIIHRDIKPANIFISENGSFKLGDFGIAKAMETGRNAESLKGTYTFMAPEVYKGIPYDSRVDIYSLGIVLYSLLNDNRTPFLPEPSRELRYADTQLALNRRMKGEPLPPPKHADKETASVILKACAYDPDERYSSPAEMLADLEALRNGTATVSATDGSKNDDERTVSIVGDTETTVSVTGGDPGRETWIPGKGGRKQIKYNVDIAMCIDATGSMNNLLDIVKKHAISFYDDLVSAMINKGKHIDDLRVRIVVFRDYLSEGTDAMLTTDFFSLPRESRAFADAVNGIKAFGGGDPPEDGLEALAYAIKSKWTSGGNKRRHIIIVWTDDATHPIGFGRCAPNYPQKMPADFEELSEWWGDRAEPGLMDNNAKRLLIFAPDRVYWNTISDSWDNVIHYVSYAGQGLKGLEYEEILSAICNSI